jgi:hypothetical protein
MPVDDDKVVLDGGNELWICLTENVANMFGGTVLEPDVNRPDWSFVSEQILSLETSELLKCEKIIRP